jgi:signal peptidase II
MEPISSGSGGFFLRKYLLNYLPLFSLAGIIVVLDQWTKALVRENLALGNIWAPWPWIEPYVRIVHWNNTGAAFGMLQGFGDVFTILAIIVAIAILYYYPQVPREDWLLRLAMGLQLGGALGNLVDRLTIGSVTDFIMIWNFPVFNISDASISTGVAILIISVWLNERKQGPPSPEIGPEAGSEGTSEHLPEET